MLLAGMQLTPYILVSPSGSTSRKSNVHALPAPWGFFGAKNALQNDKGVTGYEWRQSAPLQNPPHHNQLTQMISVVISHQQRLA